MSTWDNRFVILKDDFEEILPNRTIRSDMDIGPAKVRRRTILGVTELNFKMYLTPEIYEMFKTFYLENDVGVFDFLRPDNNTTVQARFKSVPSATMNESLWSVAVNLEILP